MVLCGCASGMAAAKKYEDELSECRTADETIRQLMIFMEYQAPTISQMLKLLKTSGMQIPEFIKSLPADSGRSEVLESLEKNGGCYCKAHREKLYELFSLLGSADKSCEMARLEAAHIYFLSQTEELSVRTRKQAKLARSIGALGGILLAVLLV